MNWNRDVCIIKSVYCGKGVLQPERHSRNGTGYECLRQGIGAVKYAEKRKSLPKTSLQQIKYVSEYFEQRFKRVGISSQKSLLDKMSVLSKDEKKRVLKLILKLKNGNVDYRAYNYILLFLDDNSVSELPNCKKIK